MSDIRFTHTDQDDDTLIVRAGMLGAVIRAQTSTSDAAVAVRYEYLPELIAALQGILDEPAL